MPYDGACNLKSIGLLMIAPGGRYVVKVYCAMRGAILPILDTEDKLANFGDYIRRSYYYHVVSDVANILVVLIR